MNARVLIVEDDPVIRSCLVADINKTDNFAVVGACNSVASALRHDFASYDILLLDLNLIDGSGFEILKQLRQAEPKPKVLVLSVLGDDDSILKAIEQGADAYLLKDSSPEEVILSLEKLISGESHNSQDVIKAMFQAVRNQGVRPITPARRREGDSDINLSPREYDALTLLATGLSYQQMADEMGVTYHTAAQYVKQVYTKLGVRSKNEAIYKAIGDGILYF